MAAPKLQHIDRPEIPETFVDGLHSIIFDGQTFRLEFTVGRLDEMRPGMQQPTGKSYTVCRLVMPPNSALELFNKMSGIVKAMEQKGLLKHEQPKPIGPVE